MLTLTWSCDIEAARDGDRAALERVLARSRQDLRRYAEYHCVVNDVEDAVQESLLQVSRKITDLRAIEAFAGWLFRIVKRECNRLKRVMRYWQHEPIPEEIEGPCYPAAQEIVHDIACALESLPAHYRQIILLRDLDGMTIAEICQRLDLSQEAAKARLHRARCLAREYLSPPGSDPIRAA